MMADRLKPFVLQISRVSVRVMCNVRGNELAICGGRKAPLGTDDKLALLHVDSKIYITVSEP